MFPDARPDDGMLELGIVTAEGLLQWTRTLARTAVGDPNRSPFVRTTKASSVKVALDRKVRYELDGGERSKVKSFKVGVEERALSVCVPQTRMRRGFRWRRTCARCPNVAVAGPLTGPRRRRRLRAQPKFEWLARAGLAARGVIYAVIGVLAIKLAFGDGGKTTNQNGALQTIAKQPFGKALLIMVAVGLAGYAIWRLLRAAIGHGPEGSRRHQGAHRRPRERDRLRRALSDGREDPAGSGGGGGASNPDKATGGVLGWPGGTWLVAIVGAIIDRRGSRAGLQGPQEEVPRRLEDRAR